MKNFPESVRVHQGDRPNRYPQPPRPGELRPVSGWGRPQGVFLEIAHLSEPGPPTLDNH